MVSFIMGYEQTTFIKEAHWTSRNVVSFPIVRLSIAMNTTSHNALLPDLFRTYM
jgi:hypothetical protein